MRSSSPVPLYFRGDCRSTLYRLGLTEPITPSSSVAAEVESHRSRRAHPSCIAFRTPRAHQFARPSACAVGQGQAAWLVTDNQSGHERAVDPEGAGQRHIFCDGNNGREHRLGTTAAACTWRCRLLKDRCRCWCTHQVCGQPRSELDFELDDFAHRLQARSCPSPWTVGANSSTGLAQQAMADGVATSRPRSQSETRIRVGRRG